MHALKFNELQSRKKYRYFEVSAALQEMYHILRLTSINFRNQRINTNVWIGGPCSVRNQSRLEVSDTLYLFKGQYESSVIRR